MAFNLEIPILGTPLLPPPTPRGVGPVNSNRYKNTNSILQLHYFMFQLQQAP